MAKNTSQWLQEHWLFDRITTTLELICWKLVCIWLCSLLSIVCTKALKPPYQAAGPSQRILPSMILFWDLSLLESSPSGLLLQESNWLLFYAKLHWQEVTETSLKFEFSQIIYSLHIVMQSSTTYATFSLLTALHRQLILSCPLGQTLQNILFP